MKIGEMFKSLFNKIFKKEDTKKLPEYSNGNGVFTQEQLDAQLKKMQDELKDGGMVNFAKQSFSPRTSEVLAGYEDNVFETSENLSDSNTKGSKSGDKKFDKEDFGIGIIENKEVSRSLETARDFLSEKMNTINNVVSMDDKEVLELSQKILDEYESNEKDPYELTLKLLSFCKENRDKAEDLDELEEDASADMVIDKEGREDPKFNQLRVLAATQALAGIKIQDINYPTSSKALGEIDRNLSNSLYGMADNTMEMYGEFKSLYEGQINTRVINRYKGFVDFSRDKISSGKSLPETVMSIDKNFEEYSQLEGIKEPTLREQVLIAKRMPHEFIYGNRSKVIDFKDPNAVRLNAAISWALLKELGNISDKKGIEALEELGYSESGRNGLTYANQIEQSIGEYHRNNLASITKEEGSSIRAKIGKLVETPKKLREKVRTKMIKEYSMDVGLDYEEDARDASMNDLMGKAQKFRSDVDDLDK